MTTQAQPKALKTRYEYILFTQVIDLPERKTSRWDVRNIKSGDILGEIRWYGPWRQYCFSPVYLTQTIYSAGCLADIQDFIKQLMDARKNG